MTTGHELAMALRCAYLAMHRRTDTCLARHGVTADQFVILATLAGGEAVTQRELARRTSSDPNTVRAMLLLLEARGLVVRQRHPSDARARTVALTARGRRMYDRLWRDSESVRAALLATLRPGDADALRELLGRVAETLCPRTQKPTSLPRG